MGKLKMRPWRNLVGAALPGALITIFALLVQPPVAHSITDPWATPDNYASAIPGGAAAWECKRMRVVNEDGTPIIPDAQTCANLGAAYDNTQTLTIRRPEPPVRPRLPPMARCRRRIRNLHRL